MQTTLRLAGVLVLIWVIACVLVYVLWQVASSGSAIPYVLAGIVLAIAVVLSIVLLALIAAVLNID